jgi:UDP:flavonoid glycosyltransferase YjiC (YdhE family)
MKVIFYLNEIYKEDIESIGAELRVLKEFNLVVPKVNDRIIFDTSIIVKNLLKAFVLNCNYLMNEIEREKPDLIIYDTISIHAIWLFRFYNKWFQLAQEAQTDIQKAKLKFKPTFPLPKLIGFVPSFAFHPIIYPNRFEIEMFNLNKWDRVWDSLMLLYIYLKYSFKMGLEFSNPFNDTTMKPLNECEFHMISMFPEVQPRSHLFPSHLYKFIGCTLKYDEKKVSQITLKNNQSKIIDFLKCIDDQRSLNMPSENNSYLIYVSLGTVFNENFMVYEMIIEALCNLEVNSLDLGTCRKKIKQDNLRIIVSTSNQVIKKFEYLKKTRKFHLPANIILIESAPQVEILKRACLFITHSGSNSTNESVYFGVPMIFIPLAYDQPFVAYRCADELGFGIRLDLKKLSPSQIRHAVHQILNDDSFSQRVRRYSKISKEYVGYINGSRLINNCLTKLKI